MSAKGLDLGIELVPVGWVTSVLHGIQGSGHRRVSVHLGVVERVRVRVRTEARAELCSEIPPWSMQESHWCVGTNGFSSCPTIQLLSNYCI